MANILTGLRVICSIGLLFVPAYSVRFYLLYIASGITDMLDGKEGNQFTGILNHKEGVDLLKVIAFFQFCGIIVLSTND